VGCVKWREGWDDRVCSVCVIVLVLSMCVEVEMDSSFVGMGWDGLCWKYLLVGCEYVWI